jgi:hypothetical protein
MIIATFSLVHERVVELLRWWIGKLPWQHARGALDVATKGAWAWVPGIALSIATNANLLDAFRLDDKHQPLLFATYFSGPPTDLRAIVGCCMMGLAVTLGSCFWHDLGKGLIEVRRRLKYPEVPPAQQLVRAELPAAPPAPAEVGPVAASHGVPGH